ncbi:MAG: CHASE2 domain-containing protein, partial [Akkermansiaceae bacterium]|nr:CHASE2 domain-containing protein [Verrucomicrobiales bacterium]
QTSTPAWDRNLHAQLLDRLTEAKAKLVVFDLLWNLPGTTSANTNLSRAIRDNGRVILAAALESLSRPQVQIRNPVLPLPEFLEPAAGWGITEMMSPDKAVARQYYEGTETQPGLPWRVAELVGAKVTGRDGTSQTEAWLNYYGPALTLKHVSYCDALRDESSEMFRDKVVFVGARPKTLMPGDEADAFRTPHTLWRRQFTPGVEITATAFLNILRNEGLVMLSWPKQVFVVLLGGLIFGGVMGLFRPLWALGFAALGGFVMLAIALQVARQHIWFPWTVVAFAQIPLALAWSLRCHFHRLKFEKEVLERTLVETSRFTGAVAAKGTEIGLLIPDHTLLRCVGRGAYGEVWLARNAIGAFHAVKIVQRRAFPAAAPYEREFKGIQKFMPISRSHLGFVNVLHVGRNDDAGYFFYIMEPADDRAAGQKIDPQSYSPKTLAMELNSRGKLLPEDCVKLGIDLSLALEHLHQQQLIHRDIKPGNIIYVNGAPKFADIGLVTEQRSEDRDVSRVGTEGYIPPEGPGTPGADVYALGKVLYEAVMGRDRLLFPEVPTAVWEEPDESLLRRLNDVIGKACASDVAERYPAAKALHEALLALRNG